MHLFNMKCGWKTSIKFNTHVDGRQASITFTVKWIEDAYHIQKETLNSHKVMPNQMKAHPRPMFT